jgi:hypothetical protein
MSKILAIELENFQSITERVRIDLKPITLLYGPNSAGKSAVFDALTLVRTLLYPKQFNHEIAQGMAERWARRAVNNRISDIQIAIEIPFELWPTYEIFDAKNWPDGRARESQIDVFYDDNDDSHPLIGSIVRIELSIRNARYLSELKCIVCGHSIVTLSRSDPEGTGGEAGTATDDTVRDVGFRYLTLLSEASIELPIFGLDHEGVRGITITKNGGEKALVAEVTTESLSIKDILPALSGEDSYRATSQLCRYASDIMFYFGTYLYWHGYGEEIVRAERSTPESDEVFALVAPGLNRFRSRYHESKTNSVCSFIAEKTKIGAQYLRIAESAHAQFVLSAIGDECWDVSAARDLLESKKFSLGGFEWGNFANKSEGINRLNLHLGKSLFLEKIYSLYCESTLLVPLDLRDHEPDAIDLISQPAIVRLLLKDGEGTVLEFKDVGSGIPYVIPVIFAACTSRFAQIQQPELHLHPALQSSIADVFVEEFNHDPRRQFLIETHSEHVLLRLLRRIRDTTSGKCLNKELALLSEHVGVYYFDPQVSGGTVVSRQEVTPLGDFMHDWPRGFFAERDEDLYGE